MSDEFAIVALLAEQRRYIAACHARMLLTQNDIRLALMRRNAGMDDEQFIAHLRSVADKAMDPA